MSVNRLADLKRDNNGSSDRNVGGGYEMRPLLSTTGDITSVEGFLDQVSHVKESITQINVNVKAIGSLQSSILQTVDARDDSSQRLDQLTADTQNIMTHVKQKLKEIEPTSRHTDLAMRKNAFSSVTKSFMDAIENHRRVALNFQKEEGRQLERQIKIANPNATSQDIQKAIANAEQGGGAVFTQQLLQSVSGDYRRHEAQTTLDAVQERHEDIKRLAKSVQELSLLFEEMQVMLNAQSKVLDTIEQSAFETTANLEQGVQFVEKAKTSAMSMRRKKWICFSIAVIIIIILIVVLAVTLAPKSSS
ncbi:t-SNARE [Parasitella parasitica]|nr:t-SNARE [Parasitella parasitica]